MAQRITHFYHDSQQLPDPAPVLGTSFDIADVHVHDLKPGQRPIVVNSRNWYGKLESLYIRLTSIGTATKVTIRICADANGDVILIPEIPFNYESIIARIREREEYGKRFTIIIVAEGAREEGSDYTGMAAGEKAGEVRLGGIGHVVANEIQKRTGKETRAVVLGHLQRGGSPTAWDRQLCTRFGVSAVEQVAEQNFGVMVALTPSGIAPVALVDAVDRIRTVPPDGEIVRVGRALGISFGGG